MSNSSLVNYTRISPNSTNPRKDTIKKITIHHAAGNCSVETLGGIFAPTSRRASANYGIGSDGRVGMYVEECNRAWTSGNADNDNQAITIEVANDRGEPDWHVSDKALAKLIELCVDICKRNDIEELVFTGDARGNLTMHSMFEPTRCPGEYLKSKFPYIASEVNKRLKPTPTYVGYLDTASSTTVTGWAWNSIDDTALKVELKVYRNGQVVRTFNANANVYRADLKAAGKGNGSHGFNTNINFNGLGYGTFVIKAFVNGVQLRNEKTVVIEAPKATATPKPSVNVSTSNVSVSAGQKLTLKKVKLYSTSTSTKDCGTVTGTYYIWSASVENGRVRITNSPSRVGVNGQVTGFVNVSDIGVKASTTVNTAPVVNNNELKDGDRIKLKSGATYVNGNPIPVWVKVLPLYYRGKNDSGVIFSTKKTGAITGVVKADMVTKA